MRAATHKLIGATTFQRATTTKQQAGALWLLTALLLALALMVPSGAQAQSNYVYVNDQTAANSVNAYSVSSTGALTPLAGSPYSTGGVGAAVSCYGLNRITISGANNLMFVANTGDQTISVFQINPASGTLTLVAGSPFASGLTLDACQGISLAVTPDGAFLMASSNGQINTFSVAASGTLTAFASTPNCCTPMAGMVISANGKFLAVSNENSVSVYTIAAGVLTPVLGSPFSKTGIGLVSGLDFSCAGDRLYGGEATGSTTITDAWTVNANGVLTPVPGSPFHTAGTNSNDVHLSPDNTLLFESNQFSNSVNSSNVNADGSLSNVGKFGSTTAVHVPAGMATDADGRFLYVADDNFGVAVFRINAGGILTPLSDNGISRPGEIQDLAAYPPRSCASADLSITKSASPTVVAGSPIVYTITITNNGPAAASAVVSDTVPAGTTPGGNLKIVAATGAQRASGVVTIHTTAPHQAFVGEAVVITGVGDASFNGTFAVASVPDGSTFTYSQAGADATSGGGSATTPNCQVPAGGSGVCGAPLTARSIPITASTGAKRVSGVVTITTTAPHVLLAGQTVTIAGVANTTFNGTFPIVSVLTPTTFTYSKAGVDATSGGGSVATGQTLTVAFNSLASGETQTAILTTTTATSAVNGTVISNTATIGNKSAVDAVPGNNFATASVTVGTPVGTTLTVPNGTGPYGGLATLSAVLKNSVTNAPIAGKTLTFQLGGNLASAVTDATGTATVNSLPIGTISVGTHPSAFTVSFGGDSSFLASSAVGTLVVTKAQLTVTADNQSRLYGDANPPLTYTITGFVNGDTLAVVSGTADCTTTATPASPAGTYPITCTTGTLSATNYVFVFVDGSLTVNPAPLTVTVANASRAYGAANPAFTGTITGLKNGDVVTATYSTTATATSPVGTYPITATLVDPGNVLGNYVVTNTPGTLTVTAAALVVTANNAARLYGDPNPAFTGSIAGLVNGDNITATFTSVATPASPVGNYPIVPALSDPTNKLGNYAVTLNNGNLVVSPAPLTVTAADATRAFGTPNPAFTGTIVGIKNGDNITATYATTATATSAPGTYPIIPTLVDPTGKLGNYIVTINNGTLTITAAALTVTANNASRLYGDPNPPFTYTITGFVNGDTLSVVSGTADCTTTATPASPVGTYPITCTVGTLAAANYVFAFASGTLTVNPAPLTVTAANATRLYGAANPAFTGTITGIKNGDNITATYSSVATATSNTGTYPIVPTLVDPTGKLGNYTVTSNNGTLTVTAAPLTVTAANASRLYGDPNPVFTGTITGLLNGDNITATYASAATPASSVGTYPIVPTLVDPTGKLGNYIVTINNGTLTVTPAPLVVTAANATRAFGTPNPVFTGTIVGIKNGDNITATYNTTATATSPAGTYPIIPALVDPTGKLGNYVVTVNNGTLTITAAALTVTANNASRLYGDPNPPLTYTITGFVNGDTLAVVSGTADCTTTATPASPVGTYPITCTAGTLSATSYVFVFANGTLTVNPAPLTVTAANATRLYGAANPAFTGTISGIKNGDNITATYASVATATSNAGTYPIVPTLVDPDGKLGNYTVTSNNGTLTVTAAPLTVTAANASRLYGDPNPVFTGTITGLLNGDNITATYASAATPASSVGTYPIVPALVDPTGKLGNYIVTINNGTLTVTPAPLVVTAANVTRAFGDPNPVFTGTIAGIKNGDNITATYSTTATATSPAGTYPIIPALVDPTGKLGNYAVTANNGTLTITSAALVVTAASASRFYGDPDPVFTGTITGVKNGDTITATYASTATATSAPGTFIIVPTLSDGGTGALANYTIVINNGILTVNAAPLTVSAASASRLYGAANPVFTGTITGLKNGDNITATYTSVADPTSPVGSYPISPVLSDPTNKLSNYAVTLSNGTLTITPAPLTVTAANASRLYGDPNPAFTGTITGLLNGDNITATYSSVDATTAVGTYPIAPALVDPTGKLGNYTVTINNGTLTITPAPLSVTAANATRAFGDPNPVFTGTIAGIKNGDNITATYSTTATATSPSGTYPIVPALVDPTGKLGNYTVTINNGTLTITQAVLTVTAANASMIFGDPVPALTGTITGLKNGDTISATYSTAATSASPVGTYAIVATLVDPNNQAVNYTVVINNGTLTISPAPLTVTAANASRLYGDPNPAFTGTITGLKNGDSIGAIFSAAADPTSPVGSYAIIPTLVDPSNQAGNYAVTINNGVLIVNPAPLSVTSDSTTRLYGDPNPAFTGTLTGVRNGDNITATYSSAADPTSPVGTYPIVPTLLDPTSKLANYVVTSTNGTLTVDPAPLTIQAADATRLVGDPNPAFTGAIIGLKNSDVVTASYSTTADQTSPAGTYPIVPTPDPSPALSNYAITLINGTLTVQ